MTPTATTAPAPTHAAIATLFEDYGNAWASPDARSGSRMAVDAVDVIEVSGGLITAKHTYVDALELMRQTGISS